MNFTAATDQLSAVARDNMPVLIDTARGFLSDMGDRDCALAALTLHFQTQAPSGVAAIAADAVLRLAEETR